jgi:hypothetical protein
MKMNQHSENRSPLNRRDFNRLTSAAVGGMLAGTLLGCGKGGQPTAAAAADAHLCRGLNACANLGKSKSNACAGQGDCATVALHGCAGQNTCKGLGGCGGKVGTNECKGQGGCGVPLSGGMWEQARARFEENMKKQGKAVGAAPAAKS